LVKGSLFLPTVKQIKLQSKFSQHNIDKTVIEMYEHCHVAFTQNKYYERLYFLRTN